MKLKITLTNGVLYTKEVEIDGKDLVYWSEIWTCKQKCPLAIVVKIEPYEPVNMSILSWVDHS